MVASDAVALIGLACRFPGADSVESFWELLNGAKSAISPGPEGRSLGSVVGGFIDQVDLFDAGFFGISPAEAAVMDPQQRLLLELGWEALEDAGILPATLRNRRVGAFVGAIWDDYAALLNRLSDTAMTSAHMYAGVNRGVLANRLSYFLGLRGPSFTVDGGQASSLVAVHLACESLRRGESEIAVAGGVNLILASESYSTTMAFGGLSPDGKCYTFDARANGYVRGEGAGVVVLKPLSQAIADGDPVYCVISGSAVNNDGGGDSLTTPTSQGQQEVLHAAYQSAGVDPASVGYVELHGSGTPVGDPIEAAALGAVLGAGRPAADPLLVGSVKTNIGHLEGAAGIAGLIKVALSLAGRRLPASLNFEKPNPRIDFDGLKLRVQTRTTRWEQDAGSGPRVAGVSSFGMGGTNCHVVLAEAPVAPGRVQPDAAADARPFTLDTGTPLPWILSGHTEQALRAQARRLLDTLAAGPARSYADVGFSLATTRTFFEYRAVVVGTHWDAFLSGLRVVADGDVAAGVVYGRVVEPAGSVTFVFPGQGSQWAGMARQLLRTSPVFAWRLAECAEALAPYTGWSVLDVVRGEAHGVSLERVDVVQPVLFAVMVSLAQLWRACGVEPAGVVGHSQGEIAAAVICGAFTLADAAAVVALRSQSLVALSGRGAMATVSLPAEQVELRLRRWGGRLGIAAANGPRTTVVSGDPLAIDELLRACAADDVRVRRIAVDYASHGDHVEQVRDALLAALADVTPLAARLPWYSTVTGERHGTDAVDVEYWYRGLRRPVRFQDAIGAAVADGSRLFIEVSPHPIVSVDIGAIGEDREIELASVSTLKRDDGGAGRFVTALSEAFVRGAAVDWRAVFAGVAKTVVKLPAYAFQRRRHWLDTLHPDSDDATDSTDDLPLLLRRLAGRPQQQWPDAIAEMVVERAVMLTGRSPAEMQRDGSFRDWGFDSLLAVELCNQLCAVTGLRLPSTLLFDYPTPAAVSQHLLTELFGLRLSEQLADRPSSVPAPVARPVRISSDRSQREDELIAIVGVGCRYPGGVSSLDALWRLVVAGDDAITGFPEDRGWDVARLFDPQPGKPGHTSTRYGGFLSGATDFDAEFFGISPREALAMDPQQRVLLEISWEAIERAGIDAASLRGSSTGVFVGAMSADYGPRLAESANGVEGYMLTGAAGSVISGRVAYALGLEGPAITVDTACSSSLVAIHWAANSLRSGECDLALAGGVTVMATPGMFLEFSRQRGLSPDGRCKSFAADADGTGWAEGAGVLVLERLSDAQRNGHSVLAVIRGSAINQDGASNGLSAPNGLAQQRVIRQALADARLEATDIDVVEAHGTGTKLGDPIEAHALLATYGQDRPAGRPLWLGSIKSNIGHTQAAAGVAGVIKMVAAMRYGILPQTLHADEPTPHVDWASGAVSLLSGNHDWPRGDSPRRAAVSSFGISGTNAHLILEQPSPPSSRTGGDEHEGLTPWVLSAKSVPALRDQARRLLKWITDDPRLRAADIGLSLATSRSVFDHRAVVLGDSRDERISGLRALADDTPSGLVVRSLDSHGRDGKTAFLFSGQGAQHPGMGVGLYAAFPVFAEALDEACAELDACLGEHSDQLCRALDVLELPKLLVLMFLPDEDPRAKLLQQTVFTQASLFAIETALFRLLESWNVVPDFLAGHSIGEITAAHAAGLLTLPDACALVAARGRLMQLLPGGAMLAVTASEDEVLSLLDGRVDVDIAAVNGRSSVVISGTEKAIGAAGDDLQARGLRIKRLAVSHAFHSRMMSAMLEEFRAGIAAVAFHEPRIPLVSNVSGRMSSGGEMTTVEYWADHVQRPVRFADGLAELDNYGVRRFLEIGPDAVLTGLGKDRRSERGDDKTIFTALMRKGRPECRQLLTALAEVFSAGERVDWSVFFADATSARVELPTYPFQRQRFWYEARRPAGSVEGIGQRPVIHPVLSAVVPVAGSQDLLATGRLSMSELPMLDEHRIFGVALLPGTAFVDLALCAGAEVGCDVVTELILRAPLPVPAAGSVDVQVIVKAPANFGRRPIEIYSRTAEAALAEQEWTLHAVGELSAGRPDTNAGTNGVEFLEPWPPPGADVVDVDVEELYRVLDARGYQYGDAFRGVRAVWRRAGELFASVTVDPAVAGRGFRLHPALLDAAVHPALHTADPVGDDSGIALPFIWTGISRHDHDATSARVRITPMGNDRLGIQLADTTGSPIATVECLVLQPASAAQLAALESRDNPGELLEVVWSPAPIFARQTPTAPALSRDAFVDRTTGAQTGAADTVIFELKPAVGDVAKGVRETMYRLL
jgi:acyl transferase domain-containing protein